MTALTPDAVERLDGLYRRYADKVARVAQARTRDLYAAQDVAAEAWARAAAYIPTLRADDDHAGAWLAAITRRAASDFYRPKGGPFRDRSSTEEPTDWEATPDMLPTAPAAEDEALAMTTVRAALLAALTTHPPTTRTPAEMTS